MTLMEKFATLTPEQREKFTAVKNAARLDAFASEQGIEMTDEEKSQTLEYIKTGILPLSDDELDAAAGGEDGLRWGGGGTPSGTCPRRGSCIGGCIFYRTPHCVRGDIQQVPGITVNCPVFVACKATNSGRQCQLKGTAFCENGVIKQRGIR